MLPIHQKALNHLNANRFTVFMHSRMTGILNVYAQYVLDYVTAHDKRNVVICSPFGLGVELFEKIFTLLDRSLVSSRTGRTITLHNGCCIKQAKLHKHSFAVGITIDKLIVLEAALTPNAVMQNFYNDIFPLMTTHSDSSISIASAPNGYNFFQKLFSEAEASRNAFAPMRVYYWMIEGRDEQWVKDRIQEMGSEKAFNQEYNLVFYKNKKNI